MDTNAILNESKLRFNHESAKAYLTDKFKSRLIIADQGGLWTASPTLLSILESFSNQENVILIDDFQNPVKVNVKNLKEKLLKTYNHVMEEYYNEWKELEIKR